MYLKYLFLLTDFIRLCMIFFLLLLHLFCNILVICINNVIANIMFMTMVNVKIVYIYILYACEGGNGNELTIKSYFQKKTIQTIITSNEIKAATD